MKKNCLVCCLLLLFSLFFISCGSQVTLVLNQDDSVDISFNGSTGDALGKMILSATGGDTLFDLKQIEYELSKAGFTNVQATARNSNSISIKMTDKKQSSYIFNSGLVRIQKGDFVFNVTPAVLNEFYASADEQTQMLLDLFIAPVFNDEKMAVSEYLELLSTIYGEDVANEVGNGSLKIVYTRKDKKQDTKNLSLPALLCGIVE